MEILNYQVLNKELEEHVKKLNDATMRKYKIEQIIKPHTAELSILNSDIDYQVGIINTLTAIISKVKNVTDKSQDTMSNISKLPPQTVSIPNCKPIKPKE